jgi:carbon monoxide dehydrogenase subunit G
MAQVTVAKELSADQDKVWAVIANPARFEEWLTVHTKWKDQPPTELAQGTQMTEVVTIMGMPNTITWTTETYQAPNSLKISGAGMAGAKVSFTLSVEAKGDSSIASVDAEFISQMMVGAIGGAVERAAKKELDASLAKLADLVA